MDIFDNPLDYERGRTKLFLEARDLVQDYFPESSNEAKMRLIGDLVPAHATMLAGKHIGSEVSSSLIDVATAIREKELGE